MRLSSFRIKNFKSIIDSGVCRLSEDDNIVVLAGQNESGKSALIEALDFFRNGPAANFYKLQKRRDVLPYVECEFILSAEDIKNVFNETKNDLLQKMMSKDPTLSFVRCENTEGKLDDIFFSNSTEEKLKLFFKNSDMQIIKNTAEIISSLVRQVELNTSEVKQSPEEDMYSLDDLLDFLLPEMRKFIFFDSFDDLLPGLIKIEDILKSPSVQHFQSVFDVNFLEIVKKDDRGIHREELMLKTKASDDLNSYWTQKLEKDSKYNFNVRITRKEPVEQSSVEFMIDRTDNDPLYLEQKSKGFRWFSSFNLHLRALGVKDSTIKKLVILIDEPGQGLHEKAQKDLKNVLEELAKKGAQIIYTTHYPNLIGTVGKEFSRIRLVSNTISHGTKVDTVAKFASQSNDAALDALSPIITAMGIQSVGQFITKNQYNIVVEGITDHYYLSALAKIFENDFEFNFLPACGVSNVCNLVSVLIGWGLNYKAIFDDDAGSGRKAYNLMKKEFYEGSDEEAHKHVFKISGCIGIEDVFSQKDFYKHILNLEVLPDNVQQPNSKLAEGRKEPLARIFLQKVEAGEKIKFDENTSKRVKEIFIWLRKSFFLLEKNDASIPTIS